MRIAIGNDHAATQLKFKMIKHLESKGIEVVNFGTNTDESVDYPVYAQLVANSVAKNECDYGILICGTGIGISIAANKVNGIRAACCSDPLCVRLTRLHNDANILCFGARIVGEAMAQEMVDVFIETKYEGGRHDNRLKLISDIEGMNIAHK